MPIITEVDCLHCINVQVLSISQIHGGDSYNTIPDTVTIGGTFRAFKRRSFDILKQRIEQVCSNHVVNLWNKKETLFS